jgi:Zn-dependent peptidase ImmA (M78 family)/transcriptional regulator with XRE-family HTH domain
MLPLVMISTQQLGERLADARKRARLTQAEVADRLGVARTTLVAIEKGERRPSHAELVRLGEILATSIHDLQRETFVRAEISPRFRSDPAVADAVERLRTLGARYAELERLHGLRRVPARLGALGTYLAVADAAQLDDRLAAEDAARTVRGMLGLGDEPALHLDDRLEADAGLRIFRLDRLPSNIAAILVWIDDVGACVALNAAHVPERMRWSLVHELGHLLRDPEVGDILDETTSRKRADEIFPDRFATEFLLPAAGVQKRFADKCRAGRFTLVELFALARAFEVSFGAMTLRLEDLRLLPQGAYQNLIKHRISPGHIAYHEARARPPAPPSKLPERYVELAVAAYDQELLSEGELAAYLETDIADARRIHHEHQRIELDDGAQLPVDLMIGDLRTA